MLRFSGSLKDMAFLGRSAILTVSQGIRARWSTLGFKLVTANGTSSELRCQPSSESRRWPASVATYEGRGGIVGVVTALMGGMARDKKQAAAGSQVTFAISPDSSMGRTECSIWLSQRSTSISVTNDARFFRAPMRAVEEQIRALGPALTVDKARPHEKSNRKEVMSVGEKNREVYDKPSRAETPPPKQDNSGLKNYVGKTAVKGATNDKNKK